MANLAYLADQSGYFALIVAVLISLCAGLLGVMLVLKRYSMIGDGLSHVAFGAYAVATVLSFADNMFLTIPVTVIVAILLLRIKADGKIKGETLIAMLSAGALAIGYMIMSLAGGNNVAGDVCTTLFGGSAILNLTITDVIISTVLALVVIILFIIFYNRFFSVTFDEKFAKSSGVKASLYKTLIAVITAIVIVLSMELVGALLISALIVFPALSAMRLVKSFKKVVIVSSALSVGTAVFGVLLAIAINAPIGSTVVVANIVVFLVCFVIRLIVGQGKVKA